MLSRLTTSLAGAAMVIYGVIAALSPLPGGIFFLAFGALMIVGANPAARPALRRLRKRWPWFNAVVKTLGRAGPRTVQDAIVATDPQAEERKDKE